MAKHRLPAGVEINPRNSAAPAGKTFGPGFVVPPATSCEKGMGATGIVCGTSVLRKSFRAE